MLDLYMDLPAWLRTCFALAVLAIGVTLSIVGYRNRVEVTEQAMPNGDVMVTESEPQGARSAFRFGLIGVGVGVALLLVSGKSSSEKKGYRF